MLKNSMLLYNWLIRFFPSFPRIHLSEYELLQQECLKLSIIAKRLQFIPKSLRSKEDNYHIDNLPFYQVILDYPLNKPSMHFIEWFEHIKLPQTTIIWSEIIQKNLFQTEFTQLPVEQDLNLKLFKLSFSLLNTPYSFSGLILAFFLAGYPSDKLLSSGILHNFFQYQSSEIHIIEETYQLLLGATSHYPGLGEFIHDINQTFCGLTAYPRMSLFAQNSLNALTTIEISTCPIEIDDFHTLEVFIDFFEIEFVFILLIHHEEFEQNVLREFLKMWVQLQASEDLEEIFHKLKSNLHQDIHFNVFRMIVPHIPIPICQNLFSTKPDFFWILLSAAPQLSKVYDKSTLRTLACDHAFNVQQIPFIAHLCTKPAFLELHDVWVQQILESYLLQPELELTQYVIHIIKSFAKTKTLCHAIAKKWHHKLIDLIEQKTIPFTESNFIDIRDLFFFQRKIVSKIELLGYTCQLNFKEHYDLTSYILSHLLSTQPLHLIDEWLNIFVPNYIQENQSEIETLNNKKRLVVELLKRELKAPREIIILKAINILVFKFDVPLTKLISILEQENISIKILALKSQSTLSLYLELLHPDTHINHLISRISSENHKSIMHYAFNMPDLLMVIVKTLNAQNLYKLLCLEYRKGEIYWHLMGKYSYILSAILDKLPIQTKKTLLLKTNKYEENILHASLPIAASVETILLHSPDNIRVKLLTGLSFQNISPFTLALDVHDCFLKILDYLDSGQLTTILETSESCDSRFIQIFAYPELFNELLQHLEVEEKKKLVQKNLRSIVKSHLHQKDIIQIILNQFDGVNNFHLLETEINDHSFARHLLKFPESFIQAYQTVNPNLRLNLIINCHLLNHLAKPQLPTLEHIIRGIPSLYVLNFFEYMIEFNPKLIDVICSEPNVLNNIISRIPKRILWQVISYKNLAGDNFLKHLPVMNTEIITTIIQSFPSTIQWSAITSNYETEKSLFERGIYFPNTFSRIISFLTPQELYDLVKPGEYFESLISKCNQFESILLILQNIPKDKQIQLLAQKHLHHRDVLHGFFSQPLLLPRLLNMLQEECFEWMCEKIQNQAIYYREIHHKPLVLLHFLKNIPYPYFSKALIGLCFHYPEQIISKEIQQLFNQHHQPNSPMGRLRWFMRDSQPNPQLMKVKTYHDWLEILEGDIKETHELSPRTRIV